MRYEYTTKCTKRKKREHEEKNLRVILRLDRRIQSDSLLDSAILSMGVWQYAPTTADSRGCHFEVTVRLRNLIRFLPSVEMTIYATSH
jgi:hypothetical protein